MNSLQNFVNWKLTHADKIAEAEGYPLIMENCKKYKRIKQLEVYGNSVQDGTPTPEILIEVQSVGEPTVNIYDANTYPLTAKRCIWGHNGTMSTQYSEFAATVDFIPCTDLQGKDISINHTLGGNVGIAFYDETKAYTTGVKYSNATSITVTVPTDAIYYRFSVDANYIDEIQVQLGTTITEYEPYGKYKIPVTTRGRNLLNIDDFCNNALVKNDDGTYTLSWSGYNRISAYNYNASVIKAGSTIVFNYEIVDKSYSENGIRMAIRYVDGGVKYIYGIAGTSYKVDKDINFIYMYIPDTQVKGDYIKFKNFITYYVEEAAPYEPYVEPVTTNVYLDEPLRRIGDYADYINFKENKVVRKIREIGSAQLLRYNLMKYSSTSYKVTNAFRFVPGILSTSNTDRNLNIVCSNMFEDGSYIANKALTSVGYSEGGFMYLRFDGENNYGVTDVETLKEWLSNNNNLLIYYVRSTAAEEPITCELPKLKAKTIIIEVDTDILPSDAYGKYIKK